MDPYAALHAVPPALVERARRLAAGQLVPVTPLHASTVVLLREHGAGPYADGDPDPVEPADPAGTADPEGPAGPVGQVGLEAYVLRRRTTMAFAPGMYAFPGGSVDARDLEAAPAWSGPAPGEWADRLGFTDERLARASVCAAVRETFEESGVLLAGPTSDSVVDDTTGEDWEADRTALLGRALPFGELLRRRGLVLRSDLLAAWDHWITPRAEERRFDTRFFVAALPPGQRTRDVSTESDRVAWIAPSEALAAIGRGEMTMLPPTYHTLAALADLPTVNDALTAAEGRRITPVMPSVSFGDGGSEEARWVLPDGSDRSYDEGVVRGTDRRR